MAETKQEGANKPTVFISYSRADSSAFAEQLVHGLQLAGFTPYLDRNDIEKAVEWEDRLGALILKSDSVVFVISPGSVCSDRCRWELDRSLALSKRVIPIEWIKASQGKTPDQVWRLNFIDFAGGPSFEQAKELARVLRQDVLWMRRHTWIAEQAQRWEAFGDSPKAVDVLLRGIDLEAATLWRDERPEGAPEITALQGAFIDASARQEAFRLAREQSEANFRRYQRKTMVAVSILAVASVVFFLLRR